MSRDKARDAMSDAIGQRDRRIAELEAALRHVRKNVNRDHEASCAKTKLGIGCLWCETNVIIDAALSLPAARVVVDPDRHVFVAEPPPSPVMPSPTAREVTKANRKVFDCVMRDCPACGSTNVEFRLEDREIPYGGVPGTSAVDNPDQQWLKCHCIVQHCNDCTEEFLGWQSDAIVDAAVLVYKEGTVGDTVPTSAVISSNRDVEQLERDLRSEWWSNHTCEFSARYGDDGEMSCGQCGVDFKRMPIDQLREHVERLRLTRLAALDAAREGK